MDDQTTGRNLPVENPLMLINGELVESESGRRFSSINPANEEELATVPEASAEDVERAYEAAAAAQPGWAALSPVQRGDYLRKLSGALQEQAERILITEVIDTGNTIAKMRGDVGAAVSQLNYFSGLGYELKGDTVPATPGNLHMTVREPYGVVGRIIPFNHPIMFAAAKLGPALMAGNTVIEKPSEQSPLSASILAEICA
ncbi:MAG TPA: aldehyde dehydrogenase family protein, partial [Alphaproteobacteria bacterium]|nr:aldehyde dehydrogenase family protein [Alphaproteobacteria bacterium]